jgi:hypothetical protein
MSHNLLGFRPVDTKYDLFEKVDGSFVWRGIIRGRKNAVRGFLEKLAAIAKNEVRATDVASGTVIAAMKDFLQAATSGATSARQQGALRTPSHTFLGSCLARFWL